MKYVLIFALFCILSCSKKGVIAVKQDHEVAIKRFESDSVPQIIKNEIMSINCNTTDCDSLIQCYGKFFKYLYANLNPKLMYRALDCAVEKAIKGDENAHRIIIEYYGSPFTEKKNNEPDWAKRLRGEDAFEITLEYMRQSKGLNVGVGMNRAYSIFDQTLSPMLKVSDGTSIYSFYRTQKVKYAFKIDGIELENWLTTDFIDILKKEIKEGRVVFKKYGEK